MTAGNLFERHTMQATRLPTIRLSVSHRRTVYTVCALLWGSGVLWLLFRYFMRLPGEFGDRPHLLEIWWLRLHGLCVLAALVGIGSLLPIHARLGWQLRRNRASGLGMKFLFLWLAATGYALYYFANDDNGNSLAVLHWAVGLPLPLLLAGHVWWGRQRVGTQSGGKPLKPQTDVSVAPASVPTAEECWRERSHRPSA